MTISGSAERRLPRALVTGASRGIGHGIAAGLARAGYEVTLTARNPVLLEAAVAALCDAGGRAVAYAADLGRPDDVDRLVRFQLEMDDALDVLVLCAGVGTSGRVAEYPAGRVERQMAVNF